MSYVFEWDPGKAASNVAKHRVRFEEAATVFGDPLAILSPDPDHSVGEMRFLLLGSSNRARVLVVAFAERSPRTRIISARPATRASANAMKKTSKAPNGESDTDRDTMRPHYDFSGGVRGATAARYAQGTNLVLIDPDVADIFPDGPSVNEALKALASVIRGRRATG